MLDAVIEGDTARVPVEFADAFGTRRLEYRMQRIDGRWLLRDIDGGSGRFTEALGLQP